MKVELRLCDVCRAEVDANWPLHVSANEASSPTGEFLGADFCSVDCLRVFFAEVKA